MNIFVSVVLIFTLKYAYVCGECLDIVGYYGNSGNAVDAIPRLSEINENYNVLILTFIDVDTNGTFTDLDIQGPYAENKDQLKKDIKTWKAGTDPYKRKRLILASIGGQNGRWPAGVTPEALETGALTFLQEYNLDGFDLDLEGPLVQESSTMVSVVKLLISRGYVVTAAPEAAQSSLVPYEAIVPLLTWVHPQFYNNGPNAVTTPFLPNATLWPTPWTVSDWQAESQGESFWGGVLSAIGSVNKLTSSQLGMLIPTTTKAASQYNNWDISKLVDQVRTSGISHVGTWAIAYDNANKWNFAKSMGKLNLNCKMN